MKQISKIFLAIVLLTSTGAWSAETRNAVGSNWPSWLSQESIDNAIKGREEVPPFLPTAPQAAGRKMAQGYQISVDTSDAFACRTVFRRVQKLNSVTSTQYSEEEVCRYNAEKPLVSFIIIQDADEIEISRNIDISAFKSTEDNLANDTKNLALTMTATMGVLWMLPGSVTGWDKEAIVNSKGVLGLYEANIKAGPVIDKDDWQFNYIGHPVSGAAYYVMARHNGLSQMKAFGYSVMMSTFFWEYGFEAVAEIPSIQDLFITPIIGSIMGEMLYRMSLTLEEKQSGLLGNKSVKKFVRVLLNPMGAVSTKINRVMGSQVIKDSRLEVVTKSPARPKDISETPTNYLGIRARFLF